MAKIDDYIEVIRQMAAMGKSAREIGEHIGYCASYVSKTMLKRGIKTYKPSRWADVQLELDRYYDTIEQLAKDMTTPELAEKFEISYTHMWKWLDMNDIKAKPAPKGRYARV